jgi:predicted O-methyltransferase YrrM
MTTPVTPSSKEGYENVDFSDYVSAIDTVDGTFDLIVIDGRAREACFASAQKRLGDDGLIVFDNSRRRRYRRHLDHTELIERKYRGLTPTLPYPDQTSLLRPPTNR